MSLRRARPLAAFALLLVTSPLFAQDDIPLRNWAVPTQEAGHLSTLADVGFPSIFVGMSPCRVADTRGNGYTGAYGPPILTAGATRTFNIVASGCTGIPTGVSAFSLNFTVVGPTGAGMLLAWPAGGSQPSISVLNYVTGQTVANAAIVPAGSGTSINVVAGVHSTNLIIDINGYFLGEGSMLNAGERLWLSGNYSGPMLFASNQTGDGVFGSTSGTAAGRSGVSGWASGSTGATYGVQGHNVSGTDGAVGVGGDASGAAKVYGVRGQVISAAATKGSAGVYGRGAATTAITSGVLGESASSALDSAGVIGRDATTLPAFTNLNYSSGVLGESSWNGVTGVTAGAAGYGVNGIWLLPGGGAGSFGYLGGSLYGVYASGNMGASGAKTFVEPHPYKPGTVIRYVALEGPEAGTYFRGRGRFVGGSAVIEVPESFRLVTDEEGITVQITPMGGIAAVGVMRVGLDSIEVGCTKDLEFSYTVQGVRKTFKDWQVEMTSQDYMPRFPTSTIPAYLSDGQKRNLIQSGVYNEDGTVNMTTARRLGWDKVWEERSRAIPPGN